ncbi:hypothetical protein OBBRIDRAFT_133470 [Obba rivulosa]|uniref:Uncharacterized protein n=1 Tax=Obba rivulosa TaxID=1052685 RepID=A0A8E2DIA4_9APHY|nr:hypothetical protein OBBRIDRAFT_133470 [Obba rivulosa]
MPQLFARRDAPLKQKACILSLFASCVPSEQLSREIDQSRVIEPFLSKLLQTDSGLCQIIPSEGFIPTPQVIPLVVAIRGVVKAATDQPQLACARMAYAVQRTLLVLVIHHYRSHGWQFDRELSEDDVKIPLNSRLFVYGIVHNTDSWSIFSIYPDVRKDDSGRFRWFFRMTRIETLQISKPLNMTVRVGMLRSMLAIEQHTYLLRSMLQLVY